MDGTTGYTLDRSISSNGPWGQVYSGSAAQYPDSGLQPRTTYYYEVRAYTSTGNSAFSSPPVSATTWAAVPVVTGISPTAGPLGGGTSVTITGSGFTAATMVDFGTTAASSFTINSDTQITATSAAGTVGPVYVTVTTTGGTSTTSSNDQFSYTTVLPLSDGFESGNFSTWPWQLSSTGFAGQLDGPVERGPCGQLRRGIGPDRRIEQQHAERDPHGGGRRTRLLAEASSASSSGILTFAIDGLPQLNRPVRCPGRNRSTGLRRTTHVLLDL